MSSENTLSLKDTNSGVTPDWCPGCGDFGILMGIKKALVGLGTPLHETCIVSGIGCSGKLNHFVNTYGFEGIHGRSLPLAAAVALSNPNLNVVAVGGDGDGYGIGMGHFMHTLRRNINFTYIVHNNQIYGLTKGQYSPTTEKGMKSSSSPYGAVENPVNPIKLALASEGATFIARGFAGDIKHLHELIMAGMNHRGFALIDVLQPCVTFNKLNTYEFFKSRVYKLQDDEGYSTEDKTEAMKRADEWDERIATGIFYQEEAPVYSDSIVANEDGPIVHHDISQIDVQPLFKEYM